ncbi:distal membrane-arm assembly complex protein 2 [Prorops nasuta]|uniref:distal membrane-arm assembly complex protein 2 n=1 Tax=Prorops nasuta TaxID=863751 RepID=UPI0034CE61A4
MLLHQTLKLLCDRNAIFDCRRSPFVRMTINFFSISTNNRRRNVDVINISDKSEKDYYQIFLRAIKSPPSRYKTFSERVEYATKLNNIKATKFNEELLNGLGANLAAAHIFLARGCKIKFKHDADWRVEYQKNNQILLPTTRNTSLILSAIDASDKNFYYECVKYFEYLPSLEWLSLRNNAVLDDWSLDKLAAHLQSLKYLDISECPRISERGLESFYLLQNLETLKITNYDNNPTLEVACVMLESAIPKLKCFIYEAVHSREEQENKQWPFSL